MATRDVTVRITVEVDPMYGPTTTHEYVVPMYRDGTSSGYDPTADEVTAWREGRTRNLRALDSAADDIRQDLARAARLLPDHAGGAWTA